MAFRPFSMSACVPRDVEGNPPLDSEFIEEKLDICQWDGRGSGGGSDGGGGVPVGPPECLPDGCIAPPDPESNMNQAVSTLGGSIPREDGDGQEPDDEAAPESPLPTEAPPLPETPPEAPEPGPFPATPELPYVFVRSARVPSLSEGEPALFGSGVPAANPQPRSDRGSIAVQESFIAPAPYASGALVAVALVSLGTILYAAFVGFYNHLSRDRVPEHPLRRRLLDLVAQDPGLGCADAAKQLGVHLTTAQHHLRMLTKWKFLNAQETPLGLRYFAPDGAPPEAKWQQSALLRRPSTVAFLQAAMAHGEFRAADIARDLGIANSTASYRARTLLRAGVLESNGSRLTVATAAVAIRPSFPPSIPGAIAPTIPTAATQGLSWSDRPFSPSAKVPVAASLAGMGSESNSGLA